MKIIYKKAEKKDVEDIARLQADAFLEREPMTMALGFTYDEYYNYLVKIFNVSIDEAVSFIAIDEDTNKTVGMTFCVDALKEVDEDIMTPREKQAVDLSNSMFSLFSDAIEKVEISKPKDSLYFAYASVHIDYLRMGIYKNLHKMTCVEALKQNYKSMIGYPTNIKSEQLLIKNNYTKLKDILYSESNIEEFKNVPNKLSLYYITADKVRQIVNDLI